MIIHIKLRDFETDVDVPERVFRRGLVRTARYITHVLAKKFAKTYCRRFRCYVVFYRKWYDSHYKVILALLVRRFLRHG